MLCKILFSLIIQTDIMTLPRVFVCAQKDYLWILENSQGIYKRMYKKKPTQESKHKTAIVSLMYNLQGIHRSDIGISSAVHCGRWCLAVSGGSRRHGDHNEDNTPGPPWGQSSHTRSGRTSPSPLSTCTLNTQSRGESRHLRAAAPHPSPHNLEETNSMHEGKALTNKGHILLVDLWLDK